MHSEERPPVRLWERLVVRLLGISILRRPSKDWSMSDERRDYLMAFHYCPQAKEYRFDRHYDPLSRAERFRCGACGIVYRSEAGFGMTMLRFKEAALLAGQRGLLSFIPVFFWFVIFGFGKHTPEHREGKTSGELELEALEWFSGLFRDLIESNYRGL